MQPAIDETHDPSLVSWVESANRQDTDFPIQNLPLGRFRRAGDPALRIGVAIGDWVLDLQSAGFVDHNDIHRLIAQGPSARAALRAALSAGLRAGSPLQITWQQHLVARDRVRMALPCEVRDYTDFYTGIHHATTVGKLFRPDNPLMPNYKWVPIGYHGRASSLVVSGTAFARPCGQTRAPDAEAPVLGPSRRLDYELELGAIVADPNPPGQPVPIGRAEQVLLGFVLLNDWSARDIQAWEYQPLGPFLAKNFASTLSPWVVTMEGLAPFRAPFRRPVGDPAPLPYLDSDRNRESGAIDIRLQVHLQTAAMRAAGQPGDLLSSSSFLDAYWTVGQLVAHHTVNGCNLQTGDLLGTGTLSGPDPGQGGSLLELSRGGKEPITLSDGERRVFLEDGDCVTLRGRCERPGFRAIGFGDCSGTVTPPYR